ncbi:MAG TPA: hypothetical protein VJQ25_05900 [Nitrospira sp.]|nr:hypothetical protein [Nitrospira sp.]
MALPSSIQGFPLLNTQLVTSSLDIAEPWDRFFISLWQRSGGNIPTGQTYYLIYDGTDLYAVNSLDGTTIRILTEADFAIIEAQINILEIGINNVEKLAWAIRRMRGSGETIVTPPTPQPWLVTQSQTTNYSIGSGNNGTTYNNIGAAGDIVGSLPAPADGLWYRFAVYAAHYHQISATGGVTISSVDDTSVSDGYIRSNLPYSLIQLEAQDNSGWIASNVTGPWGVDV